MPNQKRPWSMFPALHETVVKELEDYNLPFTFNGSDDDNGCIKAEDVWVAGRFICYNPSCNANGWSSKAIATTVRMYRGNKYNVRVYHQRCKRCKNISRPRLDETYAERVANRLKIWKGVRVERPFYIKKKTPPHNEELCEGCKHGHCLRGRN